jgi:hypothetical protein
MPTIVPFRKDTFSFGPEDLTTMSMALEDVCRALNVAPEAQTDRETVAVLIIELAGQGERSPSRLRDLALQTARLGTQLMGAGEL